VLACEENGKREKADRDQFRSKVLFYRHHRQILVATNRS
jgi:hypothetical protein